MFRIRLGRRRPATRGQGIFGLIALVVVGVMAFAFGYRPVSRERHGRTRVRLESPETTRQRDAQEKAAAAKSADLAKLLPEK